MISEREWSPNVRRSNLICEEVSGEVVVYDKSENRVHHLNATMAWFWQKCDGTISAEKLAADFNREFNVTNGAEVVLLGLSELVESGLLEASLETTLPLAPEEAAVSRRALVAKAAVVLPGIVSILAPTAAQATSKEDKDRDKDKDKDKDKAKDRD